MPLFERVILLVLDSVGIGEMPDAAEYGDAGSDTLGNTLAATSVHLPNLERMGLANIRPLAGLCAPPSPSACYGKAAIASAGKDTTTGHWEMAGLVTTHAFPTYPTGFPERIIRRFEEAIGTRTLGNVPASGTEIIARLGEEHIRTGFPIVYTSADSVFQIAAHEDVIPLERLYEMCEIARALLRGPDEVGRVIARPFVGTAGAFVRTHGRRDYAVDPPGETLLDKLKAASLPVVAVGKIGSIFCHRGTTSEVSGKGNMDLVDRALEAMKTTDRGLVFVNLVDFDMLFGHRNDVAGYARALEEFDDRIPEILEAMRPADLLVITADHGCDPTTPSTDHSREFVPVIAATRAGIGAPLGTRASLADIGQTIAANFGLNLDAGSSFLGVLAATGRPDE